MATSALAALDRLERQLREDSRRELLTRWDDHRRCAPGAWTPATRLDADDCERARGWRDADLDDLARRRAEMVWRFALVAVADSGAQRGEAAEAMFSRRNRAARLLGFPSYWALWLHVEELDAPTVDGWLDPGVWLEDPVMDGLASEPDAAVAGAADLAPMSGVTIDIASRPSGGGRAYLIDPPRDVRVVTERPTTPRALRAFAHELGHAVYARSHHEDLSWSLADAPTRWLHEGIAEHVADRLVGRRGVDPGYWRWVQACTRFERDAYRETWADLDDLWRRHQVLYTTVESARSWRDIAHFRVDPGPRYLAAEIVRVELAAALGTGGATVLCSMMAAGASAPAERILRAIRP